MGHTIVKYRNVNDEEIPMKTEQTYDYPTGYQQSTHVWEVKIAGKEAAPSNAYTLVLYVYDDNNELEHTEVCFIERELD